MCLLRKQCKTFTEVQDTSRAQRFACVAQRAPVFPALERDCHFNALQLPSASSEPPLDSPAQGKDRRPQLSLSFRDGRPSSVTASQIPPSLRVCVAAHGQVTQLRPNAPTLKVTSDNAPWESPGGRFRPSSPAGAPWRRAWPGTPGPCTPASAGSGGSSLWPSACKSCAAPCQSRTASAPAGWLW